MWIGSFFKKFYLAEVYPRILVLVFIIVSVNFIDREMKMEKTALPGGVARGIP